MGEREAVLTWTENLLVMSHYDKVIVVLDRMTKKPISWSGQSKTDVNLINRTFVRLGVGDVKAKVVGGVVMMFNGKESLKSQEIKDYGRFLKAITMFRFNKMAEDETGKMLS